jgi:hypothetical protein
MVSFFYKTTYLYEEVNRTEPSLWVRVPSENYWRKIFYDCFKINYLKQIFIGEEKKKFIYVFAVINC